MSEEQRYTLTGKRAPKGKGYTARQMFAILGTAILLVLLTVLSGCASAPQFVSFDEDKLDKIPIYEVCADYYILESRGRLTPEAAQQLRDHLLSRHRGPKESELSTIARGSVRVGYSRCGLYMAMGKGRQNKSVGTWGTHIQHIYRAAGLYVYTRGDVVTSWQQ